VSPAAGGASGESFDRLRRAIDEDGYAALVVVASEPFDPDLAPFLRGARLGEAFLVAPRAGAPRLGFWTPMERGEAAASGLDLLTPEALELARLSARAGSSGELLADVLESSLAICGVEPGPIALAGTSRVGAAVEAAQALTRKGWSFEPGSGLVRRWRRRKGAAELHAIRRAAEGTNDAFRAVARRLATAAVGPDGALTSDGEPLTVGRLKQEIALLFASRGLVEPRANIVAPGEEGGVPHNTGRPDRVLRTGESLIVDLFPRAELFADCTRTFCVGDPPEALARAHADVRQALDLAHRRMAPGVVGWDLQREVCGLLSERGWPTPVSAPETVRGYVHNLGHGVGYELHELPSFRRDDAEEADGRIAVGDVATLEPGLYEPDEGGFGVRLEDLVAVHEDGCENLTPLPYGLDPRAW